MISSVYLTAIAVFLVWNLQVSCYNPHPTGAYIHIPFCRRRCFYCDFPVQVIGDRKSTQDEASSEYVNYLLQEIGSTVQTHKNSPLTTVYFGGGTPSLMPPKYIHLILDRLQSLVGISDDAEITLEMDPGTFDKMLLNEFLDCGITRISLGVQSFSDSILEAAGRAHRNCDTIRALDLVRSSRVREYSLDLISGLPGLCLETWKKTLQTAGACGATHISVYDLQVEDKTAFGKWYSPGVFPLPNEEDSAEMYRMTTGELKKFGFEHYEISNYALPGHRSRHNQKYWSCEPVYGFGMGATSLVDNMRFTRPKNMKEYKSYVKHLHTLTLPNMIISAINHLSDDISHMFTKQTESEYMKYYNENEHALTKEDQLLELVMLSLRTIDGLYLPRVEAKFGKSTSDRIFRAVAPFQIRRLVNIIGSSAEGYTVKLTDPDGFLFSNEVISSVFAEISESFD
mmetsp:Transcript_35165/g.35806  ORF Transcript_35165/g.35806 Transcript_35165/m.35806 type:complete len:455 (-) Transcript_35165:25-1389(-)